MVATEVAEGGEGSLSASMKRRDFFTTLAGCSLLGLAPAIAQRLPRVVFFTIHGETTPVGQATFAALRSGLRERGWIEGKDIIVEGVWTGPDASRFAGPAAALAQNPPHLVVAVSSAMVRLVRTALPDVPIVFVAVSNPDGQGFVASLSKPGGNITGFTHLEYSIGPKWVHLLKQVAPAVSRVLVVFNPDAIPAHEWLPPIQARGRSLGVDVLTAPVRDAPALERAITDFGQEPGGGLLVMPEAFTALHRDKIIDLAARLRLPAVYPWDYFAKAGGLISYGSSFPELVRRAADYADRILKGTSPGDLPVQQPTRFETIVNLKTARALGLAIPAAVLAQADEVIE